MHLSNARFSLHNWGQTDAVAAPTNDTLLDGCAKPIPKLMLEGQHEGCVQLHS